MNSLETLKQEILKQKTALESKGVTLTPANTNPSPSEITAGINSIIYADLGQATATEEDVATGKTFYSGDNTLKTGSGISKDSVARAVVCGVGSYDIIIPTDADCTSIRQYCFASDKNEVGKSCFHGHDITIPDNITVIYGYAFNNANLTGTLTIHSNCMIEGVSVFMKTQITHLNFYGRFYGNSTCARCFSECPNLESITLVEGLTLIPHYTFQRNPKLKKLVIPSTVTEVGNYFCRGNTVMEYCKFLPITPPTVQSSCFSGTEDLPILVPYDSYYSYSTSTNYTKVNTMIGFKSFNSGESLPASNEQYTLEWYATVADAINKTNPVTSANSTAEYYSIHTAI